MILLKPNIIWSIVIDLNDVSSKRLLASGDSGPRSQRLTHTGLVDGDI
jgi:hypothetical protein